MISSLSIENFALIDKLTIDFSSGFTTITGETGAGKSILLGALGLALGNRADLSALKSKDQKCVIEAVFQVSAYNLESLFEELEMDFDSETIIRREILPGGKSRAFVNDSPVNLVDLQKLGSSLLDIHSQHETRELSGNQYQLQIIDAYAKNDQILAEYGKMYKKHKQVIELLRELKESSADAKKEESYHTFLLEELQAAKIIPGEIAALEDEISVLSNVELVVEQFKKAKYFIDDEQIGISANLREFRMVLQRLAGISTDYGALLNRLTSVAVEFDDLAAEFEHLAEKVTANPDRLQELNTRLQMLLDLMKKHQVSAEEDLLSICETLKSKILNLSDVDQRISDLESQVLNLTNELDKYAKLLHEKRALAIPDLVSELTRLLGKLGMPHARFDIRIKAVEEYFLTGKDTLVFNFSANKGTPFGLLSKVASGGELSRIMLVIKSILSRYQNLPTLVFDEIDTGVSGEIAAAMGEIMSAMSTSMQIFSITHLPQIAAKGRQQYKVFKEEAGQTTRSAIVLLGKEDRIMEIARMLSGATVSDTAIDHARALLD